MDNGNLQLPWVIFVWEPSNGGVITLFNCADMAFRIRLMRLRGTYGNVNTAIFLTLLRTDHNFLMVYTYGDGTPPNSSLNNKKVIVYRFIPKKSCGQVLNGLIEFKPVNGKNLLACDQSMSHVTSTKAT